MYFRNEILNEQHIFSSSSVNAAGIWQKFHS